MKNRQQEEIRQGSRQVEAGHYFTHKDMKAWLPSWGTADELPPPRCVCGKNHRESFMKSDRSVKR